MVTAAVAILLCVRHLIPPLWRRVLVVRECDFLVVVRNTRCWCGLFASRATTERQCSFFVCFFVFDVDTCAHVRCARFVAKEMHCLEASAEPDYVYRLLRFICHAGFLVL